MQIMKWNNVIELAKLLQFSWIDAAKYLILFN